MNSILVTGAAGYIGSHTLIELHKAGYNFVVYDNLINSSEESLDEVSKIIDSDIKFVKGDIRDINKLREVFKYYNIDSIIHFAGLKAVGDSIKHPIEYYDVNVNGTIQLLKVMKEFECKKIIFSSSATVYGDAKSPISESNKTGATANPYGTSKYFIEQILKDAYRADNSLKIGILRYFNPIGAHESGTIGEDPAGVPNNLMPYIAQVAIGKISELKIYGADYNTKDGTGVRDYIHIQDLANAHIKALNYLETSDEPLIANVGSGVGYSVLEIINTFEKVNNVKIPYRIIERRPGDIAKCYANIDYIKNKLKWKPTKTLEQMCKDSWRWENNNYPYLLL